LFGSNEARISTSLISKPSIVARKLRWVCSYYWYLSSFNSQIY